MLLTGKQKHVVNWINQIAGEHGEEENLILNIEVIMTSGRIKDALQLSLAVGGL